MGLYDDLITKITTAFNGKLADAMTDVTIIEFGDPSYDAVAGTNTPIETSYSTRAVRSSISEEDIRDEPTLKNGVTLLILDSEKQVTDFKIGTKILLGSDPQTYKIIYTNSDPANVTHTLKCGRWS